MSGSASGAGSLPASYGALTQMTNLQLSFNKFIGAKSGPPSAEPLWLRQFLSPGDLTTVTMQHCLNVSCAVLHWVKDKLA